MSHGVRGCQVTSNQNDCGLCGGDQPGKGGGAACGAKLHVAQPAEQANFVQRDKPLSQLALLLSV